MVPNITPIMENQMEKKMENEMETGIIMCCYKKYLLMTVTMPTTTGAQPF